MRREAPIMSVSWYLSERYATYGEGRADASVGARSPERFYSWEYCYYRST